MKVETLFSALGIALFAGGCTVGPDYQPPVVETPAEWSAPPAGASESPVATRWWSGFADPTLDHLVELAVANNHDVRIAAQRILVARADRVSAAAAGLPSLSANAGAGRSRQSKAMTLMPVGGVANTFQAGFDASWEIDLFGGTRRSVEAADAALDAAVWDRRDVLVSLLGELGTGYAALRTAQDRIAIARRTIAADREGLDLARERFQHGLGSELDVAQAKAELDQVEAALPPLETIVAQKIHALALMTGRPPEALEAMLATPAAVLPAPPTLPVTLPSEVIRNRPDIRRAERMLASANAMIGVAIADKFPKFDLAPSIGGEAGRLNKLLTASGLVWSVAANGTQKIWSGGALDAAVDKAEAVTEENRLAYEQTVFKAFSEVEDALSALGNERRRFDSLREAVAANRIALQRSTALYRGGLAPFINVVNSERNLYATEDALAQSDLSLTEQTVALYKALGGGWQVAADSPPDRPVPETSHPAVSGREDGKNANGAPQIGQPR